jgi:hypothetical protein
LVPNKKANKNKKIAQDTGAANDETSIQYLVAKHKAKAETKEKEKMAKLDKK